MKKAEQINKMNKTYKCYDPLDNGLFVRISLHSTINVNQAATDFFQLLFQMKFNISHQWREK